LELYQEIFEFAPDAILVVDEEGCIIRANAQTEKLFGYHREELVGQPVEVLIPERFRARHIELRRAYSFQPRTRPIGAGLELFGRRKEGSEFPVDVMISPLHTKEGRLVLGVVRDMTEHKQMQKQAREALHREMLLKEIHHRVKNNLQVISSLLFLQSTDVRDTATLEILKESQSRVKAIAFIHEKLYLSERLDKVDFADYLRDLVAELVRTYQVRNNVAIHTDIEGVHLGIDAALPCGLIITELVSNVLKHAFPKEAKGEVWISMHTTCNGQLVLTVRDNGIGLPAGFEWQKSKSLGLRLVSDLTMQLRGKMEVDGSAGTTFRLTFTELQYGKDRR
jgi:PAS domain S-box-containing protein